MTYAESIRVYTNTTRKFKKQLFFKEFCMKKFSIHKIDPKSLANYRKLLSNSFIWTDNWCIEEAQYHAFEYHLQTGTITLVNGFTPQTPGTIRWDLHALGMPPAEFDTSDLGQWLKDYVEAHPQAML